MHINFWSEKYFDVLGVDERILLNCSQVTHTWCEDVDCIHAAQGRDGQLALVNMVARVVTLEMNTPIELSLDNGLLIIIIMMIVQKLYIILKQVALLIA
jgi:hypothetical protein